MRVASTYNVEDIYGDHKAEFLKQGASNDRAESCAGGSECAGSFGFIGAPRVACGDRHGHLPRRRKPSQQAERARNELATTQAEAAKKIAEAEGDAKSLVTRAQGRSRRESHPPDSLTPQTSRTSADRKTTGS